MTEASQPGAPLDARERLSAALSGEYVIERELGQGGMATVFLAHDVRHDRKVALKVLRPDLAAVIGAARFLQEIRTVANLQHPHILPLFDSGSVDGTVYYVMPFIEGESLRNRLERERQLPIDTAIRIAREVASALDYAHRRGILHRDVKPENILLNEGQALVADFGIALAVARSDSPQRLTETGMSLGTPHYMSPEQALGERTIDARTDIYSLGCVVYEMLAGDPPFTASSAQAVIARVITETPRSLSSQRRTIPAHVEGAVECALQKLPADRFATAAQFADALETPGFRALPGSGAIRTASAAPARRDLAGRVRAMVPWVIAAAALILAAAMWRRGDQQAEVVRQRIALWQQHPAAGTLGRNLGISPDGSLLVYVDSSGGTRQLWLKRRSSADAEPLAGTDGAAAPTFSPDGEWIAFISDGRLRKVSRSGGAAITLADSANTRIPAIAWQDDGTILFSDQAFSLTAVSHDGGPVRRVFSANPRSRGVSSVTPLPNSRAALVGTCTFGCPEVDLRIIDIRTGKETVLVTDALKGWYIPDGRVVFVRRDGAVFYAPFDLGKLEFRGTPVPVMDGIRTAFGEPDMVLSPNGTMIYVPGRAELAGIRYQPVWVNRAGRAEPVDPAWSYTPSGNGGVAVSPDGRHIAVSLRGAGTEDIWVRDLTGGALMRLTFNGFNIRPEWSTDGRSVFFISTSPEAERDAVVKMRRADGSGADQIVLDLDRPIFEIASTRNPAVFLVRLGLPPSRDIMLWTRGAGRDSIRPLLAAPNYDEIAPTPSPDGLWLAYVSNESGRNEIYVRPFPDVDGGRWQVSRSGGVEPEWSPNGRELIYRDPAGDLIAVPVNPGTALAVGQPRALFSTSPYRGGSSRHESYDLSPDGRFVFQKEIVAEGGADPSPLIQVENWFSTLRRPGARE